MKTNISLSELPYLGIIPYGRYIGKKCITISFAECNLYCSWLNSECIIKQCNNYEHAYYPYIKKSIPLDITEIINYIKLNKDILKIFISGCEPFLQHTVLLELLKQIKLIKKYNSEIIIETNCTIRNENLLEYIDVLMLSPKLLSCIPKEQTFTSAGLSYFESFITKHEFHLQNIPLTLRNYLEIVKENKKEWEIHFLISNNSDESDIKERYIQMYPILRTNPQNIYIHYLNDDLKMYNEAKNVALNNGWNFSNDIK